MSEFTLAEKYIDGFASEEEQKEINQKLLSDADFKNEVFRLKAMKAMLKAEYKATQYQDLSNLFEETVRPNLGNAQSEVTRKALSRRVWMVAASVSVLVAAVIGFQYLRAPKGDLYASYYKPFKASNLRSEAKEGLYWSAVEFYQKQDYANALVALQGALEEDNDKTAQIYLLMGNSHLQLVQPDEAIRNFSKIEANSGYYSDAQWYLALAYLNAEKMVECKEVLTKLSSQSGLYQQKAQKLLEEF